MRTILIVTEGSADLLRCALEAERFRVEVAAYVPEHGTFSAALLDLGDERQLERSLLACGSKPVICLLDDPTGEIGIRAFAAGAADCMRRPFSLRELTVRLRNLLSRTEADRTPEPFDVSAMRVTIDGTARPLTAGEAEILRILLDRAPSPVPIAELEARLAPVSRHTISSRIKSLRKKLGGRLINRIGIGYELSGD